jgi:hypothetical protein
MKGRAFLQALFLVLFFIGSWFFLFFRMAREEPLQGADETPSSETLNDVGDEPTAAIPDENPAAVKASNGPVPPDSWTDWIDYLDSATSPNTMRAALDELASTILTMPREEAIRSIVEFLESGADLKTGLAFQPGPGNSLIGSNSLRAFLLDLLSQLDPELAAEWAEAELSQLGTTLAPDVYAIHLRNYALGSTAPEADRIDFLNDRLLSVLHNDEWMANPTSAIAEMMDVAVYTEATQLVPELSLLMARQDPQMLRGAAALAIERIVDSQPMDALTEILQQEDWPSGMEKARAGYFARLDPAIDGAAALLEQYLSAPMVDNEEARFFLLSFPNLNRSLSNNLLSSQNSITSSSTDEEIMEGALELVRAWQATPAMADLNPTLLEVEDALLQRLYGIVSP